MDYTLNKNYIVIGNLEEDNQVLLKNTLSNRIFKLSPIEYKIIEEYSKTNSVHRTLALFSKDYDLQMGTIDKIVAFGFKYEFLVSKEKESETKDYISSRFSYVFTWIYTMLGLRKLNLKFNMTSNFNLIKLLNWNLISLSRKKGLQYNILLYSLFFISTIFLFAFYWSEVDIYYVLYNIGETKPIILIAISLPISLLISFLHEFSHFSAYKYHGGKQNEMGLALMYRFLPIFYTTTEDMVLWKNKNNRIAVALGGLINDLLFLFLFMIIHTFLPKGIVNSVISFLIFSLLIKFFYNANPFAPGSDMYFITSDLFGYESPFLKGHEMIKSLFRGKKEEFSLPLFLYGLLCYLSIVVYVTTFFTLLTLPFWINRIV